MSNIPSCDEMIDIEDREFIRAMTPLPVQSKILAKGIIIGLGTNVCEQMDSLNSIRQKEQEKSPA